MFTFFSITTQAQWIENEDVNGWIENALEQDTDSYLEVNEDGDLVIENTYNDEEYEDYLNSTDCYNLCQEGHTDDPQIEGNQHVVITVIEGNDDGWQAFQDDYNDWVAQMEQEDQQALDDYYDSLDDDQYPNMDDLPNNNTSPDPDPECTQLCTNKQKATNKMVSEKDGQQMCPCEKDIYILWVFDGDGDKYYNPNVPFTTSPTSPGAGYIEISNALGQDCNDNPTTGTNVHQLNKCGVCEPEPVNGVCPCKTSTADLIAMFPGLTNTKATQLADILNKHAAKFGIDTKEKLQHFLAQVKKETQNLTKFTEDVEHYKLTSVSKASHHFYKYFFPTKSQEKNSSYLKDISDLVIPGSPYLDAKKLSNIVYDDRNLIRGRDFLLGNTQDGDGYNFRGGGALHLTGRENYTDFNTYYNSLPDVIPHDFTKNPELIHNNTDNLGIIAGMWYFMTKVLKPIKNFQARATSSDLSIQKKLNNKVSEKVQGDDSTAGDRLKNLELAKQTIKCN